MSNEEKPQQEGMLQIEISPEVAQGTLRKLGHDCALHVRGDYRLRVHDAGIA